MRREEERISTLLYKRTNSFTGKNVKSKHGDGGGVEGMNSSATRGGGQEEER